MIRRLGASYRWCAGWGRVEWHQHGVEVLSRHKRVCPRINLLRDMLLVPLDGGTGCMEDLQQATRKLNAPRSCATDSVLAVRGLMRACMVEGAGE